MKSQAGFAQVAGTRLYYEIAGSGPALVLIHGFTVDTRMWDDQFEPFARHFQVVRFDVRGFGRSDLPGEESYSYVDDLKALLEHLGISRACALGLSMGGMIAIDFALEYPEMTSGLILAGALVGGFQWQAFGKSLASVWAKARESGIQAAKELWLSLDLFEPAMEKPAVAARLAQMVSDYSGWHLGRNDPFPTLDPPAIQRLEEISAPALVLIGERDLPDFHAIADILHEQIPGARKVILPGIGHLSDMEDPGKFNEAVLRFLLA